MEIEQKIYEIADRLNFIQGVMIGKSRFDNIDRSADTKTIDEFLEFLEELNKKEGE